MLKKHGQGTHMGLPSHLSIHRPKPSRGPTGQHTGGLTTYHRGAPDMDKPFFHDSFMVWFQGETRANIFHNIATRRTYKYRAKHTQAVVYRVPRGFRHLNLQSSYPRAVRVAFLDLPSGANARSQRANSMLASLQPLLWHP